jgi:feruloyl esterase
MDLATSLNPGGIQTSETDLSEFYKKGGKLLTYHGGADQASNSLVPMVTYYSYLSSDATRI